MRIRRQETGDRRQETGDRRQELGVISNPFNCTYNLIIYSSGA
ncbi:MAG: hypothetical protein AB4080_17995 [Trichodesmium sp.]